MLELETQLAIAVDLNYLEKREFEKVEAQTREVKRLLNGLIESIRVRSGTSKAS